MSFRYAFPRFSRMMGSYGQGFGWRRRGAGSFCRLYYGDKYWPAWRMRSPYCRRADWIESQYRDPENAPSGLRDWFNWKPWWFRENYSVNKVQDKDIAVTHTDKVYEVTINVNQFHPDDIDLQINGNKLIISGRQMAEEDSLGVISQEFTRQINIPEDVDLDSVHSTLTADGQLLVKGNIKQAMDSKTRTINIERQ